MSPSKHPDRGETPSAERRRDKRRSAMWSGTIETSRGERVNCVVLDVSARGVKLQVDHPLAKDDIVTLVTLRIGTRWCRVAWREGSHVGLEFLEGSADAPTSKLAAQDAQFLRGRAEILRRLARSASSAEAGARLLETAGELDQRATLIERQAPARSIRKGQ